MIYRAVRLIVVGGVACVMLSVEASPVQAACSNTYVVKQGDSWWRIAAKSNTTLKKVLKLNSAKQSTRILPGDQVCISAVPSKSPKPPQNEFTKAEVIQFIRDAWPDQLEERALAIAERESRFNPSALSGSKCCYGLFQIYYRWHTSWLPNVGITSPSQMFDPRLNAAAAYRLYQRNGWGPWE
jgi:soluble lytic murein transglycosylase-like protein